LIFLEISVSNHATPQRSLDEPRPFLVLRKVLDSELTAEHAQVPLDGVDAQEELRGDLPIRRRPRELP
jgi:hypothetical protein